MFVEKLVKKKKRTADTALAILIIIAAISLTLLLFLVPFMFDLSLLYLPIIVTPGVIYVAYRMIASLNKEYEYSFTNDMLTIDRITSKKRRKNLYSGSCKDIQAAASMDGDEIDAYLDESMFHLDVRSGEQDKEDWFLIAKVALSFKSR